MPQYRFRAASETDVFLLRQKLPDAEFVMERIDFQADGLEVIVSTTVAIEHIRLLMRTIPHSEVMLETLSPRYMRTADRPFATDRDFSMN